MKIMVIMIRIRIMLRRRKGIRKGKMAGKRQKIIMILLIR